MIRYAARWRRPQAASGGTVHVAHDPSDRDSGIRERARAIAGRVRIRGLAGPRSSCARPHRRPAPACLELLESEFESASESAAILRDARLAAENSSHLARQLLAVSRPQQNERAVTDVNDVIRRLDTMLDRCIGESKSVHLALDASASTVMMDAAGFEDVLVNLTINARDAMDARDTLTIETGNVRLDDLAAGPGLAGIKVLVVEDQADLRDIAGRIVSDLGCDVHTVEDGDHALEYLEAGGDPDLMFTDMVMPGCLDGIGLAREAPGSPDRFYFRIHGLRPVRRGIAEKRRLQLRHQAVFTRVAGPGVRAGRDGE